MGIQSGMPDSSGNSLESGSGFACSKCGTKTDENNYCGRCKIAHNGTGGAIGYPTTNTNVCNSITEKSNLVSDLVNGDNNNISTNPEVVVLNMIQKLGEESCEENKGIKTFPNDIIIDDQKNIYAFFEMNRCVFAFKTSFDINDGKKTIDETKVSFLKLVEGKINPVDNIVFDGKCIGGCDLKKRMFSGICRFLLANKN